MMRRMRGLTELVIGEEEEKTKEDTFERSPSKVLQSDI
jgi:hypothetical protein